MEKTILLLAALTALAPRPAAAFDASDPSDLVKHMDLLFDAGSAKGRFNVESMLGRTAVPAAAIGVPVPASVVPAGEIGVPSPVLRVLAEVRVPITRDLAATLEAVLGRLDRSYGFKRDTAFTPRILPGGASVRDEQKPILGTAVYLVRGWIVEDRMSDMSRDGSVRRVREDQPASAGPNSAAALQRFLDENTTGILAVEGVDGVSVGADCPIRKPHMHVHPHAPCLVILLNGRVPEAAVRLELTQRLPQIRSLPHRFELDSKLPEIHDMRCFLPEGCL